MAFTTVPTVATGDLWSAAQHNTYIKDNFSALFVGSAAGDVDYYNSASTKTRLAKPTVDSLLKNTSAGTPSWKAITDLISVPKRQGGSATDWSVYGTTNYTPTSALVQVGSVLVVTSAGSPATGYADVTFPVAFSYKPIILLSNTDLQSSGIYYQLGFANVTASSVRIFFGYGATGSFYGSQTINWLAIGAP